MSLRKGSDFKDVKLFKVLHKDLKHHDYTYKKGLNVLKGTFYPHGECEAGGLYVTDRPECWIRFGTLLAPVTLPVDAQVWATPETSKYKVDKLILGKWIEIPDHVYLEYVKQKIYIYRRINNIPANRRTGAMYLAAIENDEDSLLDVPNRYCTPEFYLSAVKANGKAVQYVPKSECTEEMAITVVQRNGRDIQCLPPFRQTQAICLIAVKQSGRALKFISHEERTEIVCRAAVQEYYGAMYYVPNDLRDRITLAVK